MFQNRKILIVGKHKKEIVIGPLLEKELGLIYFTDTGYDTDKLGTFTGEIERVLEPIAAARKKCLDGMLKNECELGIASEGSFGAHPQAHFVSSNEEWLIFIDKRNNIEIIVRELSTDTNFNAKLISTEQELLAFATLVKFPSHALILRKAANEKEDIYKGIQDYDELIKTFDYLKNKYQSVYVETDMRAIYNPSRLRVIETTTKKLIQKINTTCPACHFPGFSVKKTKKGLTCNLCGSPTNSLLSVTWLCERCSFEKEDLYPNKKTTEDPMYCDNCNP
jgi:hypothetical protein